jgi:hypothetical protein
LLLHPHACEPWVVHPFALAPGSCWVQTNERGYWANCLYCAFGIAAALRRDAVVTTRFGGEAESVRYVISDGAPDRRDDVFHLSTPAARWWDNVIFACSSFQPFASEASRRELAGIDNVERYLFAMLRNLHVANVRRSARRPLMASETAGRRSHFAHPE